MLPLLKRDFNMQILSVSKFRSTSFTPNSENTKNQYVYRIMVFLEGSATVELCGSEKVCKKHTVIFLTPDSPYRVLNTHGDFEVLNIFIDFKENNRPVLEKQGSIVFQNDFDKDSIIQQYAFNDAPVFNSSFIFDSISIYSLSNFLFDEYKNNNFTACRLMTIRKDIHAFLLHSF